MPVRSGSEADVSSGTSARALAAPTAAPVTAAALAEGGAVVAATAAGAAPAAALEAPLDAGPPTPNSSPDVDISPGAGWARGQPGRVRMSFSNVRPMEPLEQGKHAQQHEQQQQQQP